MSRELTSAEKSAVAAVAAQLETNPGSLAALIRFETAGTFSPSIKNPRRGSTARGLIQFEDAAAQGLGFKDSADLVAHYPDFESQIRGPVYDYLKPYHPFPTDQSLFMAVFRPSYRFLPVDTPFPAFVQKANPGITSPLDYIKHVWGGVVPKAGGAAGVIVGLVAAAAALTGFFF